MEVQSLFVMVLNLLSSFGLLTRFKSRIVKEVESQVLEKLTPAFQSIQNEMEKHKQETEHINEKLDLVLNFVRTDNLKIHRNENPHRKSR